MTNNIWMWRAGRRRRLLARVLCLVLMGSLVLAGWPLGRLVAPAAQPRQAAGEAAFGLDYIPRDALLVVAVRPAALLTRPALDPVRKAVDSSDPEEMMFGLLPQDVAQLRMAVLFGEQPGVLIFLHTTTPQAAQNYLDHLGEPGERKTYGAQTYFQRGRREFYFQPDRQTIVFAESESAIRRAIAAGPQGAATAKWSSKWQAVARQDAALLVNTSLLRGAALVGMHRELLSGIGGIQRWRHNDTPQLLLHQLAPLWEKSEFVVADVNVRDEIELRIASQSATADEAGQVHGALLTALSVIRVGLSTARNAIAERPNPLGPLLLKNFDIVDEVVEKAQISRRENQVELVAKVDAATARRVSEISAPAVVAARAAGLRTRSMNNLKQLALAFHNYHDTFKTFPAATQIGPKDIPHSWRITLLPFLDQLELFELYRQDEPWDSPHNQQLLERMPEVFRCPLDVAGSTNTSYFGLTGKGTALDSERTVRIADILDGTSNTILLVESQRDVPWTKPEDIPFDAQAPEPEIGGWYPGGFCIALCDGSARFLPDTIEGGLLTTAALRADGQPFRFPDP